MSSETQHRAGLAQGHTVAKRSFERKECPVACAVTYPQLGGSMALQFGYHVVQRWRIGVDKVDAAYHRNWVAAKGATDVGHGVQEAGVATAADQHQPCLCVKHHGHVVPVGVSGPASATTDHVVGTATLRLRAGSNLAAGPHAREHLHRFSTELQDDTTGQICPFHSGSHRLEPRVGLAKSLAEKIRMSVEQSALYLFQKVC